MLSTMRNNLDECLQWLKDNYDQACHENFVYAPNASKGIQVPRVFNFDNAGRQRSKNSAIQTLSSLGQYEVESFRSNEVQNMLLPHTSGTATTLRQSTINFALAPTRPEETAFVSSLTKGNSEKTIDYGDMGFVTSQFTYS